MAVQRCDVERRVSLRRNSTAISRFQGGSGAGVGPRGRFYIPPGGPRPPDRRWEPQREAGRLAKGSGNTGNNNLTGGKLAENGGAAQAGWST